MADDEADLVLFNVAWSDFETDGDSFLFPVVVFPAGVVECSVIVFGSDLCWNVTLKVYG